MAKRYNYIIYKADGSTETHTDQPKAKLAQLQAWVGGLIEIVPTTFYKDQQWVSDSFPNKRITVYCNEEGLFAERPVKNWRFAPAPWGDYLVGDIVVEVTA